MKKATNSRQEKPVFKHDCTHCKFVTHVNMTDYYMHVYDDLPSGSANVCVIRRYSDEIVDNASRGLDSLCFNWKN